MTSGKAFKAGSIALYALIVGLFYWQVHDRTVAHVRATRTINQFDRISPGDIVPIDRDAIVDHFATRKIDAGTEISTKDVSDIWVGATATPAEPALTVSLPVTRQANEGDLSGTEFQLCLDGKSIGKAVKPVTVLCNAKSCVVTLPLEETKDLAAAGAVKRVRVAGAAGKCGGS